MTLDLYGHPWSAGTREVRILCAELDVACRLVEVKRSAPGDYMPEALDPACKVPMLDDAGMVLGETHAILRYLAGKWQPEGPWYPVELHARAMVDQWLDWQAQRLAPLAATLMRARVYAPAGAAGAAVERAETYLRRILPELDLALRDAPYVCGSQPTLADIAITVSADELHMAQFPLAEFHAMFRWHQAMQAREACARTAYARETVAPAALSNK